MAVADRCDSPVAVYTESASPPEVRPAGNCPDEVFTEQLSGRLIGDKAFDSESFHAELSE